MTVCDVKALGGIMAESMSTSADLWQHAGGGEPNEFPPAWRLYGAATRPSVRAWAGGLCRPRIASLAARIRLEERGIILGIDSMASPVNNVSLHCPHIS